jgi:hypothetical protein
MLVFLFGWMAGVRLGGAEDERYPESNAANLDSGLFA